MERFLAQHHTEQPDDACWLLDEIAFVQKSIAAMAAEPFQPVQLAALSKQGIFVTPAGGLLGEHPEKIPLFGVQLDAAFDGGVVEHVGPVAHRQQGRMVFLTVRQFALDEGGGERERGERLPMGRGIVSQEKSPLGLVKRAAPLTGTASHMARRPCSHPASRRRRY